MMKANPIFEKHYVDYLRQVQDVDLPACAPILDIAVDDSKETAVIPFFETTYRVSHYGVVDDRGQRPDYGICVVLLQYLLMCPHQVPGEKDWVSYRDFNDAGQTQNEGFSAYAAMAISKRYAGRLCRLKTAVDVLKSQPPETDFPYDFSAIIAALPRLPLLFLFNDTDEQFPAQTSILYERRAERFLDAECRVMIDWYLLEHLKRAER